MATPPLRIHKFWTEYRPAPTADNPKKMRDVDWVSFGPLVGGLNPPITNAPISHLRQVMPIRGEHDNPTAVMANVIWDYIRPHYEKWKAGEEMPVEGTPLAAWNRLQPAQADILKAHGIYTVEQIAGMTDAAMEKFPIGRPRELKKQAQMFIDASDAAQVSNLLAKNDRTIAEQQEEIAELRDQMRKLMATLNANDAEDAPKRRGRPPKQPTEVAAA